MYQSKILTPLLVVGPSAVGKGRLIRTFLQLQSHRFEPCISYTTRSVRKGEQDGVDYNFISKQQFQKKIEQGEMIQHQNVHGNYYGKSIKMFDKIQRKGKIPILDIDINGAKTIKSKMEANCLFLLPPSLDVLIQRMKGRGSETDESMKKRVQNGLREVKEAQQSDIFTYMVCYEQGLSQLMLRYYIADKYNIKYQWLL